MAVWTRRREDVGGLTLTIRTLGSEGTPLVLLHGLGVSGQVWQGFGRLLEPSVRLVAPDLRGHGESDKPSAGYLPRDYVGDVAALLAHEPSRPLAVLGHSLGAVVAAQLAAERPELISKLILLDPPFDPARPRQHIEQVERLRHEGPRGAGSRADAARAGHGRPVRRALATCIGRPPTARSRHCCASETGLPDPLPRCSANIQAETLVVAADPRLDAALGEEAAERIVSALLQQGRLLRSPARGTRSTLRSRESLRRRC